jgi:hypothetical protein
MLPVTDPRHPQSLTTFRASVHNRGRIDAVFGERPQSLRDEPAGVAAMARPAMSRSRRR